MNNIPIKTIVFDFDGVITESMDIKTDAFKHLFRDKPKDIIDKIVKLHLDNGGMSRFEKFNIIYNEYLKQELTNEEEKRLGDDFSKFCFEKMLTCPYVKGADLFLERNIDQYMFFIVSGTPHEEINSIIDKRNLRKYFKEVLGSPGKKSDLIKKIMNKYNLKNEEAVFIGDAPTDYWGANESNIKFIARIPSNGYNPFNSKEFNLKNSIIDFTSLDKTLKMIDNY